MGAYECAYMYVLPHTNARKAVREYTLFCCAARRKCRLSICLCREYATSVFVSRQGKPEGMWQRCDDLEEVRIFLWIASSMPNSIHSNVFVFENSL